MQQNSANFGSKFYLKVQDFPQAVLAVLACFRDSASTCIKFYLVQTWQKYSGSTETRLPEQIWPGISIPKVTITTRSYLVHQYTSAWPEVWTV